MGDFPFFSNLYGTYGLTNPDQSTPVYRVSNNTVLTTIGLGRDQFGSVRSGYTSNKPRLLSSAGPSWRNPSSYSRSGYRKEAIIAGTYKVGATSSYYLKDRFIDRTYLDVAFTNNDENPLFYPGTLSNPKYSSREYYESRAKCNLKALQDLASSKASMGENLAQLNQTVDLFALLAESTVDILRAAQYIKGRRFSHLLKYNAKRWKKLVKDRRIEKRLANYWLAYWYGLKPLVSDAYGMYQLMLELSKPTLLVHGRARTNLTHTKSFTAKATGTLSPALEFSDLSSLSCQTHITGKLDETHLNRSLNRIGMLNLPSLSWELIPFSFIVDWFVPVGDVLAACTATSGLTFVGGSTTDRFERELLVTVGSNSVMGDKTPTSHYWGFGVNRAAMTGFPIGLPYQKNFFKGASRFATIAALISNLTRNL